MHRLNLVYVMKKNVFPIILDNEEQVNEFMLMLIEKSFIVNCEPRYLGAFYEGSVWCGDEHYLRITTKESLGKMMKNYKKTKLSVLFGISLRRQLLRILHLYYF